MLPKSFKVMHAAARRSRGQAKSLKAVLPDHIGHRIGSLELAVLLRDLPNLEELYISATRHLQKFNGQGIELSRLRRVEVDQQVSKAAFRDFLTVLLDLSRPGLEELAIRNIPGESPDGPFWTPVLEHLPPRLKVLRWRERVDMARVIPRCPDIEYVLADIDFATEPPPSSLGKLKVVSCERLGWLACTRLASAAPGLKHLHVRLGDKDLLLAQPATGANFPRLQSLMVCGWGTEYSWNIGLGPPGVRRSGLHWLAAGCASTLVNLWVPNLWWLRDMVQLADQNEVDGAWANLEHLSVSTFSMGTSRETPLLSESERAPIRALLGRFPRLRSVGLVMYRGEHLPAIVSLLLELGVRQIFSCDSTLAAEVAKAGGVLNTFLDLKDLVPELPALMDTMLP